MIIEKNIESRNLAKQYKELLRNSYQTLNDKDKKLIRLAFDILLTRIQTKEESQEIIFFHPIEVIKIVSSQIGLVQFQFQLHFYMMLLKTRNTL